MNEWMCELMKVRGYPIAQVKVRSACPESPYSFYSLLVLCRIFYYIYCLAVDIATGVGWDGMVLHWECSKILLTYFKWCRIPLGKELDIALNSDTNLSQDSHLDLASGLLHIESFKYFQDNYWRTWNIQSSIQSPFHKVKGNNAIGKGKSCEQPWRWTRN